MIFLNLLLTGNSPSREENPQDEDREHSSDEELALAFLPGLDGTFP